ncbi:MAG: plastocyanin/azurin family copper-binding protein [Gemmatimonadota bacterium]
MARALGTALAATFAGGLSLVATSPHPGHTPQDSATRTIIVKMVEFAFEPPVVVSRAGDVVRFVQTTATPHNVQFRVVPKGTELTFQGPTTAVDTEPVRVGYPPPRMGPFLIKPGQAYEIVISEEFPTGLYRYVCTRHEKLGMSGEIGVAPSAVSSLRVRRSRQGKAVGFLET